MSVPDQVPVVETVANGNTVVFPFNFMVVLEADLDVLVDGVLKVLGSDYSVSGVGVPQGGSVTFIPAAKPANGQRVTLRRNTPVSRSTNYSDNGDLPAETLNQDFDRLWLSLQEQRAIFSTSITRPVGGQSGWDAQGYQLVNLKDGTNPQDAVTFKQLMVVNGSAAQSATAAAQSAAAALASQNAAAGSAAQAANNATAALASQNLAQKWAAESEDVPVQGGLFSARHYAAKSVGSAADASGSAAAASGSEYASGLSAAAALVSQNAAATSATAAKADADRAQSANPDEQLKKAQNLNDLPDKTASRSNLEVFSKAETKELLDACFPIGVPIYWPLATVPDNSTYGIKFLRYNGGAFNITTYPKLAAIHPSGTLPDARADVIRVWDDSRGIDASRALLSEQVSAAPNIKGHVAFSARSGGATASSGAFTSAASISANTGSSTAAPTFDGADFDAKLSSSVYQDGITELRVRNMALNFIVRAN